MTDIETVEQEARQMRARMERLEAERNVLLDALLKIKSMRPGNLLAAIAEGAIAKVQP